MCVDPRCWAAEHLDLVADARAAADDILGRYLRLPVAKAMNLGDPKGFDQAVVRLAALLRKETRATDAEAVRAAVAVLDVDWKRTTATERRGLIARALEAAGRKTAAVPRKVEAVFGKAADEVVRATRTDARARHRLSIAADFNALDRRVTQHVVRSQTHFVRDEYGRRHDAYGVEARRIVAEGLEAGLGRDDIARDLERAAQTVIAGRGSFYWDVVAGAFIADGRSFAQMSAYAEAGIQRYVIEAVLDEHTTETCRFLDGKTFSVGDALGRFDRLDALEDPEDVKRDNPWVRERLDPETGRKELYVNRGAEQTRIAVVERTGFGTRDDRGEFSRGLANRDLMDLGVSFPPYHGLCRTTTIPDV